MDNDLKGRTPSMRTLNRQAPRVVTKFRKTGERPNTDLVSATKTLLRDVKRGVIIGLAVVELRADGLDDFPWYQYNPDKLLGHHGLSRYVAGCQILSRRFQRQMDRENDY